VSRRVCWCQGCFLLRLLHIEINFFQKHISDQRPTLIIQIHSIIWQHRQQRACKYSFSLNFPGHDCLHPDVLMRISEWVDIVLGASLLILYHSYISSPAF
jgi:hypothetical protein